MSNVERASLEAEIGRHYRWYDAGTRMWSTLHHTTLFLVPILAAAATVLLKSKWADETIEVLLTTAATVLASIAASQGFARKWQANRMSRSRVDQLRIEMTSPAADLGRIRASLLEIIRQHDEGVLAAEHIDVLSLAPKQKK